MADVAGFLLATGSYQVYGSDLKDATAGPLLRAPLQPMAGEADWLHYDGWPVLPWFGSQGAVVQELLGSIGSLSADLRGHARSGLDSNRRG